MTDLTTKEGGCACGAVRFKVRGQPLRVALCHCMTCRKAHSSAFNPFIVFKLEQVEFTGELTSWKSSNHFDRRFCATCGSRVAGFDDNGDEAELSLGSFDEVGAFAPGHENWVQRRKPGCLRSMFPSTGVASFKSGAARGPATKRCLHRRIYDRLRVLGSQSNRWTSERQLIFLGTLGRTP